MRATVWLGVFVAALGLEVVLFPWLAGAVGLPLSAGVLLVGIVSLPFWPGFLFTLLSGLLRDAIAPVAAAHTLGGLGAFVVVRFLLAAMPWDEPWRRIGALAGGMMALPLARVVLLAVLEPWFGLAAPTYHLADLGTGFALRQILVSVFLAAVFSVWAARSLNRERARRLQHL